MTIIILFTFLILLSLLVINNLLPDFSSKNRYVYTWPIILITIISYSLLISQILSGNPHFTNKVTLNWLRFGSTNLAITFIINNPVLIYGTVLAMMFLIQIIVLYSRQYDKSQPASQSIFVMHRINCIYTLIIAGLLILMADSLLVLFCGMVLITGIVIYRNLLIDSEKTSISVLAWLLIADLVYLIAILYTYTLLRTVSISEIASIINNNFQGLRFGGVGFLISLSIIVKLIRIPFSKQTNNAKSFVDQNIFTITTILIIMILLVRFTNILCSSCLAFLLIIGILISLFSAVSSIFKNSPEPVFKSLLLAQAGVFLIIIGNQTPINALMFIVSFTFANLLLIISRNTIQQPQLTARSGNSIYKSGSVWIFLFATFSVSGLLPGSGFIPRNALTQHYLNIAPGNPIFWVVLVLTGLCLLLISFASFRYFSNNLYRWKNQNTSGSLPYVYSGVLFGILILLNLYPVFTIPHFNPISPGSWIYQILSSGEILPGTAGNQLYTALGITIGIPLIGFFLALSTYHFQIIRTTTIHSVFKPVKQLYSYSHTQFTNFTKSVYGIFTWLSALFVSIEETTVQKLIIAVSASFNSMTAGFASLNRKITSHKLSMNILNRISDSILLSWEKHDLLIPFLLVLIMIIIFILSII